MKSGMSELLIKQIMADVLSVDAETIDEQTCMRNLGTWDSLAHINLITAIEQEFDTTFDIDDIERMVSFGEIMNVLEKR